MKQWVYSFKIAIAYVVRELCLAVKTDNCLKHKRPRLPLSFYLNHSIEETPASEEEDILDKVLKDNN